MKIKLTLRFGCIFLPHLFPLPLQFLCSYFLHLSFMLFFSLLCSSSFVFGIIASSASFFFSLLFPFLLNLQSRMWSQYHLYGNHTFQYTAFAQKSICPFLAAPGESNLHLPCSEQPLEGLWSQAVFFSTGIYCKTSKEEYRFQKCWRQSANKWHFWQQQDRNGCTKSFPLRFQIILVIRGISLMMLIVYYLLSSNNTLNNLQNRAWTYNAN